MKGLKLKVHVYKGKYLTNGACSNKQRLILSCKENSLNFKEPIFIYNIYKRQIFIVYINTTGTLVLSIL